MTPSRKMMMWQLYHGRLVDWLMLKELSVTEFNLVKKR